MKAVTSFIRRLREDPEFREEVRRIILTDELLALPQQVAALAEAQRRTEERLEGLAQQVDGLAQRVDGLAQQVTALAEAQRRTEERLEGLAQQVAVLAQQVTALAEAQRRTEERMGTLAQQVGRLANVVGMTVEEEAGDVARSVLQGRGFRLLEEPFTIETDGDVDVILHAQRPPEQPFYVLIEVKLRLHARDVHRWSDKLRDPAFLARLRDRGIAGRAVPYAYGMRVYRNAVEAGTVLGVGVMGPDGEIVEPKTFLDIVPL